MDHMGFISYKNLEVGEKLQLVCITEGMRTKNGIEQIHDLFTFITSEGKKVKISARRLLNKHKIYNHESVFKSFKVDPDDPEYVIIPEKWIVVARDKKVLTFDFLCDCCNK